MQRPPSPLNFIDAAGKITTEWVNWFSTLWSVAGSVDGSGTTAQRPTTDLFVGRQYFDTTLGKPIWLKSVRPTVWIKADGVAA